MVKQEFEKLGIKISSIELGELEVQQKITLRQFDKIKAALLKNGHELMEDKKSIQIEKVKNAIIDMIHYSEEPPEEKYSEYLSKRLECDYNYLSNLFSEVTGSTLQQFIIINKIERAKELIIYNELSLKRFVLSCITVVYPISRISLRRLQVYRPCSLNRSKNENGFRLNI